MLYLGDVYEKGTITEFHNWGEQYFSGLKSITNPAIGNHEYENGVAPGYFDYWDNIPSYYAYTAAGWRFVVMNSTSTFGEHTFGTPQYEFLRNELRTHGAGCLAVYMHHPLFNIGPEGEATRMSQMWGLMVQNGAGVLLTAHDHDYQRWQPMDSCSNPSPSGVAEFVIGNGGHVGPPRDLRGGAARETVRCVFTDSEPGRLQIIARATPSLGAAFGCTFQHRERARVTIAQMTNPTTLLDTFRYLSTDLPALNNVVLGHGGTRSVSVPPGTYAVASGRQASSPD